MILEPELYEKVVIKPCETYIICKNPGAVKMALESCEQGVSYILTEAEAVVRSL